MDDLDEETRRELKAWRKREAEKEADLLVVHWDPATVWEYHDGSPQ